MTAKGLFITLEGGEGAGKSTQVRLLSEKLRARGLDVITTREPGGTPEAERIRDLLVQRDGGNWNPVSECLLVFAARSLHTEQLIQPAIKEGRIVLCDRYTDSTRAYQGYGHGLPLDDIEAINRAVMGSFAPDLTFIIDVDPQEGLQRSQRRNARKAASHGKTEDRFEMLDNEFHAKVRRGFAEIAKQNPLRCHMIEAGQDIEQINAAILGRILEKLGLEKHDNGSVRNAG